MSPDAPKTTPSKPSSSSGTRTSQAVGGGAAVSTYSGSVADAHLEPIPIEDRTFTDDEIEGLVGDLEPGEIGWVELDEEGTPSTATREPPPPGKIAARVVATAPRHAHEITTPSGAPLTKHMNPQPELWDAGMLERNPPDGVPKDPKTPDRGGIPPKASLGKEEHPSTSPKQQPPGGVVNQPVQR